MYVGKKIRLRKLLHPKSRRMFIVALDHGLFMGALKGLDKTRTLIEELCKVEYVTGFMASPKILELHGEIMADYGKALVMRIDGAGSKYSIEGKTFLIRSIETAIRLDVEAVCVMGLIGAKNQDESLINIALMAEQCENYAIPLIAEMVPIKGEKITNPYDPQVIADACRIGAELGADVVKTYYTGSKESFKTVLSYSPVPVAILGGPKTEKIVDMLKQIQDAIEAGAIGIIFGRNIWQRDRPGDAANIIGSIVHGKLTWEEAYTAFKSLNK